MTAPPILWVADLGKQHRGRDRLQQIPCKEPSHDRGRPTDMQVDAAHAGVLFLSDLVDVTRASRYAELELDTGKFFLKAVLELFSQFRACRDGNHDFAFLPRRLNRLFPFRTFALRRLS